MRICVSLLAVVLFVVSVFPARADDSSDRLALVIGNAKYPDNESPLKEPINDARDVSDELKRDGFVVETGENLTGDGMRRALAKLYGRVKPGSVVLIFFSGFGVQSARQTYLLPVDAQIWTEADVRRDGFSLETILGEVNSRGAGVKIALLDASRRNPFERRFRSFSAGLAPVIAPSGSLVMYSAALSSVISDTGADRSLFVGELLKEIRVPDLTAEETLNRTRVGVTRASRGEQVPWISSSLAEDFSFVPDGRKSAGPIEPEKPKPTSPAATTKPAEPSPATESAKTETPKDTKKEAAPQPEAKPGQPAETAKVEPAEASKPKPAEKPSAKPSPASSGEKASAARPETKPETKPETPPAKPVAVRTHDDKALLVALADDPTVKTLNGKIASNPKDGNALYRRGQVYASRGAYVHAIKDFDATLRLNPKDVEALNNRCWTRTVIGDLAAAEKDCNTALRLRPGFVDALDSRGLLHLKRGEARNAIADFDAALKVNPRLTSSLYGRGLARQRIGKTTEADVDINNAKAMDPNIVKEFAGYGVY
ncbi:MAG: caspase family protein [Xanthobacteraceae bacterium]|nr:caspase family protein [Xanthobacteraceae bacterium]